MSIVSENSVVRLLKFSNCSRRPPDASTSNFFTRLVIADVLTFFCFPFSTMSTQKYLEFNVIEVVKCTFEICTLPAYPIATRSASDFTFFNPPPHHPLLFFFFFPGVATTQVATPAFGHPAQADTSTSAPCVVFHVQFKQFAV